MSEDNLNSNPSPYQSVLNQYSAAKNSVDPPPVPASDTSPPVIATEKEALSADLPSEVGRQQFQPEEKKAPENPAIDKPFDDEQTLTAALPPVIPPAPTEASGNKVGESPKGLPAEVLESSKGGKNPFKGVFFISLFIFLVILGSIILSFYQQSQTFNQTIPPAPTPFKTAQPSLSPTNSPCLLNDEYYQIGESFPSADGCNTCTCLPGLIISCTNNDCGQ